MSINRETSTAASTARRFLEPLRDDIVHLAKALVQTNSVNVPPNGTETPAQQVLLSFLTAHGVEAELYSLDFLAHCGHPCFRPDRDYTGRQNLSARLTRSGRGKSLILNGHMDTVPPGNQAAWTNNPWSGEIRNGRLYGLGSFDMKSGVAAQAGVVA